MLGLSMDQSSGSGSDTKNVYASQIDPSERPDTEPTPKKKPGSGFHLKISYFLFSHKCKEYRLFFSLKIFGLLLLTFIPLLKRYLNTILIDIYFGGNFDPDPGDQT